VLFILPWHGHLLLGTTDVALQHLPDAPGENGLHEAHPVRPTTAEVDFILETVGRHLQSPPRRADILAAWSGVRPLLQAPEGRDGGTAGLSREHLVEVAASGLVTVTGGKWTTFRSMAADVLEKAAQAGLLERRPGVTASLRLASEPLVPTSAPGVHGLDGSPEPDAATVRRLVREAFALTPEDVLARRYRWLFLDARAGQAMGRRVAEVMAEERGLDGSWVRDQCDRLASAAAELLPPFD
jgi:glycerol-3-phosphate dehydrogenase